MPSARAASLREQRNRYSSRRVLRPSSLGSKANTIQRQVISLELKSQKARYDAGLLSNEEFLRYLNSVQDNPVLTPSEVVDIEETILGFEQEVEGERLEAVYKAAPDNSEAKIESAATLAAFYQNVADQQIEGTPAHSRSLQKVAQWTTNAENELRQVETESRRLLRAEKLFELSQIEPNTVEAAEAKAQAYQQLAIAAQEDGEAQESLQYLTQANNELNKIPGIQEREKKALESANRSERLDYFRTIQDQYHDGVITAQQAAQAVRQLNDVALEANDTAMVNSINNFADSLQRDIEKGVERGTIEGLNYAIRRGSGTVNVGIKDLESIFQNEDDVFRSELRNIQRIPDAVERLEKTIQLTASYIFGAEPTEGDPEGWVGLQSRGELYDQWVELVPNKASTYENKSRDTNAKIESLIPNLAQAAAQFDALGVDTETSEAILGAVMGALPPEFQPDPLTPQNFGILVQTDDFGRQFEKVVPLNTTTVTTDPTTGIQSTINTKVGSDIAPITDPNTGQTKYVRLQTYFQDPEFATNNPFDADLLYAEFNGDLYVKEPFSQELVPAADLAQTNDLAAEFFAIKSQELEDRKRQAITRAREETPTGPLSPELQAIEDSLAPVPPQEPEVVEPQPQEVPPVEEVLPQEFRDFQAPPESFDFKPDVSQDLRLTQPVSIPKPRFTLEPSPSFTTSQIQQASKEAERLQLPQPSPLQQSGLKIDLGDEFAPPVGKKPRIGLTSRIRQAASGLGSFLRSLNPFK